MNNTNVSQVLSEILPMAKIPLMMVCIGLTELPKTVSHLCMFIFRHQQIYFFFIFLYFGGGGGREGVNGCWVL